MIRSSARPRLGERPGRREGAVRRLVRVRVLVLGVRRAGERRHGQIQPMGKMSSAHGTVVTTGWATRWPQ